MYGKEIVYPAVRCLLCVLLSMTGVLFSAFAAERNVVTGTSGLWAEDGGNWTPKSRLPDFSFAGYRGNLRPIPSFPVKVNVRDFGAVGDGTSDDTAAFYKAVDAVREGAVFVPPGRYRLTGVIRICKRGVVLRGAGTENTVLLFPRPLNDMAGEGKSNAPGGSWSWSGGAISFEGEDPPACLAKVLSGAQRGDNALVVSSTESLRPGQWVRLVMADTGGSLARYLYGGTAGGPQRQGIRHLVDFVSPIESISGNTVRLARTLRTDVRLNWKPELWKHDPSVQDVGIEDLSIAFPPAPYAGHHEEPGFNAISFEGVSHAWVRRVRIHNADSGIFLRDRTRFCTIESVRFTVDPSRIRTGYGRDPGEPLLTPVGGHHGIHMANAFDSVVSDFRIPFRFIHDIGVSAWSAGNVFSNGSGADLDIDHHRRGPYENLFTQIRAGEGTRLWQSGGDPEDGAPSGVRETFWNVQAERPQRLPTWSLQGNFIGVTTARETQCSETADWWEAVPPENLSPVNLYEAQKKRRKHY